MLLETFKASRDSEYVIIPKFVPYPGYISYDYSGMTPFEASAWKNVITVPEVRRAHPNNAEDYQKVLSGLGIRCALAGTEAHRILRSEYHSTPFYRRTI